MLQQIQGGSIQTNAVVVFKRFEERRGLVPGSVLCDPAPPGRTALASSGS